MSGDTELSWVGRAGSLVLAPDATARDIQELELRGSALREREPQAHITRAGRVGPRAEKSLLGDTGHVDGRLARHRRAVAESVEVRPALRWRSIRVSIHAERILRRRSDHGPSAADAASLDARRRRARSNALPRERDGVGRDARVHQPSQMWIVAVEVERPRVVEIARECRGSE